MNPRSQVDELLKRAGAVMVRSKKHEVWTLPNGSTFVRACTPSDQRADHNNLSDLKRVLGITSEGGKIGERRVAHKQPPKRPIKIHASLTPMAEAMKKAGVIEEGLRSQLALARLQLRDSRRANHRKKETLAQLNRHCVSCWGCWLWRKIRAWGFKP